MSKLNTISKSYVANRDTPIKLTGLYSHQLVDVSSFYKKYLDIEKEYSIETVPRSLNSRDKLGMFSF